MKTLSLLASLLALPLLGLSPVSLAKPSDGEIAAPLERPALISEHAQGALLNSLALAGERLVGVGARGVIILSDDHGHSWRQVEVPVSVTLTSVSFVDAYHGWAVGHSGVILHSGDGGESWTRQFDGVAAALAIEARVAEMTSALDDESAWALQDYAGLLVDDGPDKPLLDVLFLDPMRGFAVGAFGLAFRTQDGGKSWEPWFEHLDNPEKMHLYSLNALGDEMVIVGEQGMYLRSDDQGATFQRLQTPYAGSFFTATPYGDGTWLLAGLRGNAYVHSPRSKEFRKLPVQAPVSFNASLILQDGRALLINQAGQLFLAGSAAQRFAPINLRPLPPLADLIQAGDGTIVVAGFRGPQRLEKVLDKDVAGVAP